MVKMNKALIGGSLILLITFNLFNIINFIFQFSMARLLSLSDYGVLATLFSMIYIFGIFGEPIQTVITKYAAMESDKGKLKNLLRKSLRKAWGISLSVLILYLIVSILLAFVLKIEYLLLSLTGLMILASFMLPVNRGVMLGKNMFKSLGVNTMVEALIKLVLGVSLVFLGWKVYGAMAATILGALVAFLLTFAHLKGIIKEKEGKAKTLGIYNYTKPVFLVMLAILIFYNIDIIIARVFFNDSLAGSYAIASVLAKIIFFGTSPISKAMFPLSAENKKDEKTENIFHNALGIILVCIAIALVVMFLFPDVIIRIFRGEYIPVAASILFYLAIAISLVSLANLNLLYKLSRGKTKGYGYLLIFVIIEIALLSYFSHNLVEFSFAFITASAIFLWGSVYLLNK